MGVVFVVVVGMAFRGRLPEYRRWIPRFSPPLAAAGAERHRVGAAGPRSWEPPCRWRDHGGQCMEFPVLVSGFCGRWSWVQLLRCRPCELLSVISDLPSRSLVNTPLPRCVNHLQRLTESSRLRPGRYRAQPPCFGLGYPLSPLRTESASDDRRSCAVGELRRSAEWFAR